MPLVFDDSKRRDDGDSGGDQSPAQGRPRQPAGGGGLGRWLEFFGGRQSERQDVAAFAAARQMIEHRSAFALWKRLLREGGEQVRVRVVGLGSSGFQPLARDIGDGLHASFRFFGG